MDVYWLASWPCLFLARALDSSLRPALGLLLQMWSFAGWSPPLYGWVPLSAERLLGDSDAAVLRASRRLGPESPMSLQRMAAPAVTLSAFGLLYKLGTGTIWDGGNRLRHPGNLMAMTGSHAAGRCLLWRPATQAVTLSALGLLYKLGTGTIRDGGNRLRHPRNLMEMAGSHAAGRCLLWRPATQAVTLSALGLLYKLGTGTIWDGGNRLRHPGNLMEMAGSHAAGRCLLWRQTAFRGPAGFAKREQDQASSRAQNLALDQIAERAPEWVGRVEGPQERLPAQPYGDPLQP